MGLNLRSEWKTLSVRNVVIIGIFWGGREGESCLSCCFLGRRGALVQVSTPGMELIFIPHKGTDSLTRYQTLCFPFSRVLGSSFASRSKAFVAETVLLVLLTANLSPRSFPKNLPRFEGKSALRTRLTFVTNTH